MPKPSIDLTPRVRHITYATGRYVVAAHLLARSARRYGIETIVYTPSSPAITDLRKLAPEIMSAPRGAGYWAWKSFLVRDQLRQAKDGDLVFYTDAAMIFIADPAPLLSLTNDHPIVLFEHGPKHRMRFWTKRDCFVTLDADTPEFWDSRQLLGGFQLYRAGEEARAFNDDMCRAVTDRRIVSDDPNVCGLPNLPEFRDHRHDQAAMSILAHKRGLPAFPDPSQWGPRQPRLEALVEDDGVPRPPAPYGQIFHLHRKTNLRAFLWNLGRHRRRS